MKCRCGSNWPAATTAEAFRNCLRANKIHPGVPCEEDQVKSMVWTLDNGTELRVESDGDEVKIMVPFTTIGVKELKQRETTAYYGHDTHEISSCIVLDVKKEI